MILGSVAVGILDEDIPGKHGLKAGSVVVLYTFVGTDGAGVAPGERRTILSEKYPGTMAEKTSVPSANVFAKPANLTTAEAAALGTSWLTAYSLLFDAAGIKPGDSVLIQGAGGGVGQVAHAVRCGAYPLPCGRRDIRLVVQRLADRCHRYTAFLGQIFQGRHHFAASFRKYCAGMFSVDCLIVFAIS